MPEQLFESVTPGIGSSRAVNSAWLTSLIAELKTIPASAFAAVDESACQAAPDSRRFAYGSDCPAP